MAWLMLVGGFVAALLALNRALRRREQQGWWNKEGHGPPEHPHIGVHYRRLEVPPSEPFG